MNKLKNIQSRLSDKWLSFCIAVSTALSTSVASYASIEEGISGGMESVWGILKVVCLPIGAVALAVCGVKMLWGNSKSAEEAKSAFIRIAIALAIVFLAPLLIKTVKGWIPEQAFSF